MVGLVPGAKVGNSRDHLLLLLAALLVQLSLTQQQQQ